MNAVGQSAEPYVVEMLMLDGCREILPRLTTRGLGGHGEVVNRVTVIPAALEDVLVHLAHLAWEITSVNFSGREPRLDLHYDLAVLAPTEEVATLISA